MRVFPGIIPDHEDVVDILVHALFHTLPDDHDGPGQLNEIPYNEAKYALADAVSRKLSPTGPSLLADSNRDRDVLEALATRSDQAQAVANECSLGGVEFLELQIRIPKKDIIK